MCSRYEIPYKKLKAQLVSVYVVGSVNGFQSVDLHSFTSGKMTVDQETQ